MCRHRAAGEGDKRVRQGGSTVSSIRQQPVTASTGRRNRTVVQADRADDISARDSLRAVRIVAAGFHRDMRTVDHTDVRHEPARILAARLDSGAVEFDAIERRRCIRIYARCQNGHAVGTIAGTQSIGVPGGGHGAASHLDGRAGVLRSACHDAASVITGRRDDAIGNRKCRIGGHADARAFVRRGTGRHSVGDK